MKPLLLRLFVAATLLLAPTIQSFAIVGYVNRTFNLGDSLFANPLTAGDNSLSNLFISAPVPNGTTVSLWNPATLSYDTTSTFNSFNGSWSLNLILNPGTGARLTTSSSFLTTFVGNVLNHDGTPSGGEPFPNPPPYTGPNGIFLLGDKTPMASTGEDIFLHILGRNPNVGEQVKTLTTTSTYLGGGNWDVLPSLSVGDAVFLNVGSVIVPEPTAAALALLGLALARTLRRKT